MVASQSRSNRVVKCVHDKASEKIGDFLIVKVTRGRGRRKVKVRVGFDGC